MRVLFLFACLSGRAFGAETDTVLLCYTTNVMRFAVEDGVWSSQGDFAHKNNNYGGASYNFSALASDGRRVFVGEAGGTGTRVLEFDLGGNYVRRLALVATNIEHMCVSANGRWVYATVGISLSSPTEAAVVHRYDAATGGGGVFIPNAGTNALGETLWKLQALRGVAADGQGRLWVSNRNTGQIFLFSEADGAYLGSVSGMASVQGLHYSAADGQVYASATTVNTFAIDTATLQVATYGIAGLNNRLGITQVQGSLCSGRWDTPDVSAYDLDALTREVVAEVPAQSRQIITVPRAPLRPAIGWLLVSETVSNRVAKLAVDTGYVVEPAGVFAGGAGALYHGVPLRQPRGLASFSNSVYVAEGVAGGRILRFSKWGSFKGVVADFAQAGYPDCMPTAVAVTADGNSLYVTDAGTLFIAGGGASWGNAPTNGYYSLNRFGETVYRVTLPAGTVSVFADSSRLAAGEMLLEPRGVAVDAGGRVYCSAWYRNTNALYNASGRVYQFDAAGVRVADLTTGNPAICYYDPVGVYEPAAGASAVNGPGVLHTGNGINDIWWVGAGSDMTVRPKVLDLGQWRSYLDLEVVDGRLWYTDPEYGTLWRRTGDTACEAALTGLAEPTYLSYVVEAGPEPPPLGTLYSVR